MQVNLFCKAAMQIDLRCSFFFVVIVFNPAVDCKTVGFFLKISKEIGKACPKSSAREASHARSLFSASFQTLCLTARALRT